MGDCSEVSKTRYQSGAGTRVTRQTPDADATSKHWAERKHWNTYMKSDEEQEVLGGTIEDVPTVSCTNINNVDSSFW